MSDFKVTTSELRAKAEQLQALNAQLKAEKDNLKQLETALSAMWEGEAKDSFHNAFMQDAAKMDGFEKGIEGFITMLRNIADKYDEKERMNVQAVSNGR